MPNKDLGLPGGCFSIPNDKDTTREFFELYAAAVAENDGCGVMHMLENNDATTPVKVDLDFRRAGVRTTAAIRSGERSPGASAEVSRLVDLDHARAIAVRIMRAADHFFEPESMRVWTREMLSRREMPADSAPGARRPDAPSDPRTALVFRRRRATVVSSNGTKPGSRGRTAPDESPVSGDTKDGLHIIFPGLLASSLGQHILRGDVVLGLEADLRDHREAAAAAASDRDGGAGGDGAAASAPSRPGDLGELMASLSTTPREVYDEAPCSRNAWVMPGSDKPGKRGNPYELVLVLGIGRRHGEYTLSERSPAEYADHVARTAISRAPGRSEPVHRALAMAFHLRMRCYAIPRRVAHMRLDFADDPRFTQILSGGFIKCRQPPDFDKTSGTKPVAAGALPYVVALVGILSPVRAARREDWWRVGAALSNISPPGTSDLLDAWIAWSERPAQYRHTARAACRTEWAYFLRTAGNGPRLGLSSLEEAARADDKRAFRALQKGHLNDLIVASLKTADFCIAKLVTRMGNAFLRHKCIDPAAKIWFNYDDRTGLWRRSKGSHPLLLDIPQKLYPLMKKALKEHYTQQVRAAGMLDEPDKALDDAKKAKKENGRRLESLLSSGKMNASCGIVSSLLLDADFADRLDQNYDLVGLSGGDVFDLSLGTVRRARPTDMLSLSTGQPFYPPGSEMFNRPRGFGDDDDSDDDDDAYAAAPRTTNSNNNATATTAAARAASAGGGDPSKEVCDASSYHLEHPEVLNFLRFIRDIFPKEGTAHYVLKWLASMFEGHVRDELFHVLIGTGANGKSKLQTLVQLVFGQLFATTSIKTFTGDRADAAGATAHLQHIKNKRSVWVQEPGKHERFNVGVLKEMTGGDIMYTRGLYEEGSEFKPQAKFALVANDRPALPPDDEAVWRRMRCIRFPVKFVHEPEPGNPLQKLRDNKMDEKIRRFAPAAQWYLLTQAYPLYKREGIVSKAQVPLAIRDETKQYRAANDEIVDFIQINMVTEAEAEPEWVEVNTLELTARFTRFIEGRRPRSSHLRVAGNESKVVELFSKRKAWRVPVSLGDGKRGWTQWKWKHGGGPDRLSDYSSSSNPLC